ncbi:MAG: PAS domain S-box protein [Marinilabiliaceae bacterium]|nr:PAS domain S-box protein [Marinilabiliaceae bacterium]
MEPKPTYDELLARIILLEDKVAQLKCIELTSSSHESEERLKALSEATLDGIFITQNGYCIEANKSACELLGYRYEELIGKSVISFIHPDYVDCVKQKMKSDTAESYEAIIFRKDGATFHADIKGRNYTFNGKRVRVSAVRDITERKVTEQNLIDSENKYREVIENAGDGILIGNLKGEIIEVNKGFLSLTGYEYDEIINQHISILFSKETLAERPLRFDLLNKGQSVIFEREIIDKKGTTIPIEMNSKRPHADYYLAIIRDLRERQKAEADLRITNKQLRIAKEKAEESDRLKSAFLANMSHEIRTPMNGIIGFAELLRDVTLSPDDRFAYLDVILSSGYQLLNIINDVLEISRIETGQVSTKKESIHLPSVLNELEIFFQPMTSQNRNELILSYPELEEFHYIIGDEAKIIQVLTNLISNALKFTLRGTVHFGYAYENDSLCFYVKDSGIGIPPEYIGRIFDRFLQAEHEGYGKQRGTGLGLSICQKLVELMGGKIWVESSVAVGSTFHFTLPFNKI